MWAFLQQITTAVEALLVAIEQDGGFLCDAHITFPAPANVRMALVEDFPLDFSF